MRNEDVIMSQKSYLIRAMYEWMLDYGYTPRLVICPLVSNTVIPDYLGKHTQITLDISPQAITGLMLGNDNVTFEAYFDKEPHEVVLPMNCIGAIIAKEKEVGYVFDIDDFIPKQVSLSLEASPEAQSTAKHQETNPQAKVHRTSSQQKDKKGLNVQKGKANKKTASSLLLPKNKTESKRNKKSNSSQNAKNKKSKFFSSLREKISV